MRKRQFQWITGLMTLATLAVIGLQGYIWDQGIRDERTRFSARLQAAVFEATETLLEPWQSSLMVTDSSAFWIRRDSLHRVATFQLAPADSSVAIAVMRQENHIMVRQNHTTDSLTVAAENRVWRSPAQLHRLALSDSLQVDFRIEYDQDCTNCKSPSLKDIDASFKSILQEKLLRQGITADFEWGVRQGHSGKWFLVEGDTAQVRETPWQYPMFAFAFDNVEMEGEKKAISMFVPPVLSLYFPSENWHLVRNIAMTLGASALLALMVLGCMAYAMHIIVQQKQLSEVKTEFINNMTHEFKTPISTIALACEALQDTEVTVPPELRTRYMTMIAQENDRLASQVEKVLQMAMLDRKDLGLKWEPVDLHAILQEIGEAFSIQVGQRGGRITQALEAHPAIVEGDVMHIRQMVSNLLDNANKYSPETPDIHITTCNREDGVEITVNDKGLGISRDALRKVFDRFYRVPTGNRHDVKGFGLGLAYVHSMALAHGGHVRATSKPGVGSTFYLYLPYRHA